MNHLYQTTPIPVEAFQLTKTRRIYNDDWPKWMCDAWQNDEGTYPRLYPENVPHSDGTDPLVLEYKEANYTITFHIDFDEWLVKYPDGDFAIYNDDEFASTFQPRTT